MWLASSRIGWAAAPHLMTQTVLLNPGTSDVTVRQVVMDALVAYYRSVVRANLA